MAISLNEYLKNIENGKTIPAPDIFELEIEPTHPGEILYEEFIKPLGITQIQLSKELGVSFRAINELVNKKRGITPYMALLLAKRFNTTPYFWMNLQNKYDLYKTVKKLDHKKFDLIGKNEKLKDNV